MGQSLRSFGHQGALYYVFLASDPLKTSREYAVFTFAYSRTKSVHTRTSRRTQRKARFCFDCAKRSHYFDKSRVSWRPLKNFTMFHRKKSVRFGKNDNVQYQGPLGAPLFKGGYDARYIKKSMISIILFTWSEQCIL